MLFKEKHVLCCVSIRSVHSFRSPAVGMEEGNKVEPSGAMMGMPPGQLVASQHGNVELCMPDGNTLGFLAICHLDSHGACTTGPGSSRNNSRMPTIALGNTVRK